MGKCDTTSTWREGQEGMHASAASTSRLLAPFFFAGASSVPRRAVVGGGTLLAMCRMSVDPAAATETKKLPFEVGGKMVSGSEDLMSQKAHGTTATPVQKGLRWDVSAETADRICSFNRHYAEYAGYWKTTKFLAEVSRDEPTVYYDSVSGKPLFVAPIGRSMDDFLRESASHGWPSFRDQEVVWENMRVLKDGEAVSVDGTHLGHNLPDPKGNRYCINLVSVAGQPIDSKREL